MHPAAKAFGANESIPPRLEELLTIDDSPELIGREFLEEIGMIFLH